MHNRFAAVLLRGAPNGRNTRRHISGWSFTNRAKRAGKGISDWYNNREGYLQGMTKKQLEIVKPLTKENMEKLNLLEDIRGKRVVRAQNHAKLWVGCAVACVTVRWAVVSPQAEGEGSTSDEAVGARILRRIGWKPAEVGTMFKNFFGIGIDVPDGKGD